MSDLQTRVRNTLNEAQVCSDKGDIVKPAVKPIENKKAAVAEGKPPQLEWHRRRGCSCAWVYRIPL